MPGLALVLLLLASTAAYIAYAIEPHRTDRKDRP